MYLEPTEIEGVPNAEHSIVRKGEIPTVAPAALFILHSCDAPAMKFPWRSRSLRSSRNPKLMVQTVLSPCLVFLLIISSCPVVHRFMPFLILSGQLCPPGIEGTLFALFMSINNLGSSVGSFYGAALASVLHISSNSFRNLLYGLLIQLFSTFIPIGLLFLIPKEATGLASEKM